MFREIPQYCRFVATLHKHETTAIGGRGVSLPQWAYFLIGLVKISQVTLVRVSASTPLPADPLLKLIP